MRYLAMLLGVGAIAGLDQLTKYLVVQNIEPGGIVPVWGGVFHLTHFKNTGMAFSLFEGARWIFVALTILCLVLGAAVIIKGFVRHPLGITSIVMISGGAVGNLIDRIATGEVIDMIVVEFVDFAVFIVADSFVTVGAILLVIWALFLERKKPKAEQEASNTEAAEAASEAEAVAESGKETETAPEAEPKMEGGNDRPL